MIDKVFKTIYENNMFDEGDRVVVAVSGGPDSMCLLHILNSIKAELGIDLVAAHINHGMRGAASDADEEYVKEFCEKIELPFYSIKVDLNKISKESGMSCEEAGREVRYDFFNKIKTKVGAKKIALAHNANDQAETMLMRLMRGTGIHGLVGIRAVRDAIYVRPILHIDRSEIEQYCEEHNLNARIDKTNLESIYTRNKIRLELIPYIKENFNGDIVASLNRLSDTLKNDSDYLDKCAEEKFKQYCYEDSLDKALVIGKEAFLEQEAMLTRIIRRAILWVKGNLLNLEKQHIEYVVSLQKNTTGKKVILPGGIIAKNNYGQIYISVLEENKVVINEKNTYNLIMGNNIIDGLDCENLGANIELLRINRKQILNFGNNIFTKCFDYDKIKGDIVLRYREEGDRFEPLGMKGSKKIKDLFIDLKIPKDKRDKVPLVCFGDSIAWVVGYKVSERFKVDSTTENILQISFKKEEE